MRYSVQDIKRIHQENGGYFFNRDTMKFFGDRMSDFGIRNFNHGTYLIRKNPRLDAFTNIWEFDPTDGSLKPYFTY